MFGFIENKQADKRDLIKDRILKLTDGKDYGLCSPPMNAQVALNELCRYFLGEGWYTTMPESQEQVNTEIVYDIEMGYNGYKRQAKGEEVGDE